MCCHSEMAIGSHCVPVNSVTSACCDILGDVISLCVESVVIYYVVSCAMQPEKTSHLAPPPNILPIGLPKVTEKLSPSPAQVCVCVYLSVCMSLCVCISVCVYVINDISLQLLQSLVTTYCREARNVIRFNMYSVEVRTSL